MNIIIITYDSLSREIPLEGPPPLIPPSITEEEFTKEIMATCSNRSPVPYQRDDGMKNDAKPF